MLKIIVPATSANIGVGFDVLGLSLDLYNTFYFEKANVFTYQGFKEEYANDNNLVKTSYEHVFKLANKSIIPVLIKIEDNIPVGRGLGSSSSCVVAGVLAANYFLGNIYDDEEILNICINIEGHPDNVAPALEGNLVSAYQANGKYHKTNYEIHESLKFFVVIPSTPVLTSYARKILPDTLKYQDVIHNLGRIIALPQAFKNGDITKLKEILDDRIHEPYRLELINKAFDIKRYLADKPYAFCLSGAGSSLLIIGKDNKIIKELEVFNYEIKELAIGKKAKMEEENE